MKKGLRLVLAGVMVLLLSALEPALAQGCAVCTKTAGELGEKSARGLNGGILYLAAVPLLVLGTVGFVWWKRNGSNEMN